MTDELLQYDQMVENALRSVVRESLTQVAEHGFPGKHHFYITFRTGHGEVEIPEHLKKQHPQEMTIVIEHQFWGLEVEEDFFEVTLSFNKIHERLHIPFAAVTGFADPSVKFGLQMTSSGGDEPIPMEIKDSDAQEAETDADTDADDDTLPAGGGEVVTLDAFRKRPGKS
ncbi:MAG: hypothetical protein ISR48_02775 [Alphaproteobacteria bacterium]|nr:hypothetical protein [Alphaproteobacteria bacterium]